MNFNFSKQPEYALNTSLTQEMINLYGVLTKFLITEKINEDVNVFGDYSHMKSDSNKIYDIYMLPETTEDWDPSGNGGFSQFGLINDEMISLFASYSNFEAMGADLDYITGNLIVLPNNKIMEVVDTSYEVPGVNNLFVYDDTKSVVRLTCKPYDNKLIQELDSVDIDYDNDPQAPYTTLDTYFQELIDDATAQDTEAEVTPQVTVNQNNVKVQKPIIDKSEDDVFGSF